MRDAADTLEEVGERYGYLFPEDAEWSAERLRNEVQHVETEEREEAKTRVRIELLAVELSFASNKCYGSPTLDWDLIKRPFLTMAETLVRECGWRNED